MNKDKFDIDGFEIDMESKDKPQSKKRNSGNPEKKSGSKNANSADSSDVLPPLDDDITEESPESQAAEEGLPDDDLNAHNLEGVDNEEDEEKPEGEEDSNGDEKSEDEEGSEGEEDSNDEEGNSDSESDEEHDNNDLNDYDLEDAQDKNKQAVSKDDDKPKDDKPKDRKDLNPNRAEAANNLNPSKEGLKGGAGKMAGKAKDALADKVMNNEAVQAAKSTTQAAKKMATVVSNIGTTLFQLVVNPVTYIGLGIVIAFVAIASVTSSVGQNDFNIMCDDSGVGSVSIDPSADAFTRQAAIASWLTSTPFDVYGGEPLTTEQAAGIIGNMAEESYGANPKAIQGDPTISDWETCDNDCVLGWGTVGGKAIGIVQWDTTRRVTLVNFAKSEGTQWHDLNTQLKYLRSEMESGYEAEQLAQGGFNEKGQTIAEYAKIWNVWFERSEKSGTPEGDNPRIASAEAFASEFSGGVSFAGLSDGCLGMAGGFSGVGIDTSSLVQLAISAAHVNRSSALESCGNNLVNCGQNTATDVYKQAKLSAEASTGKDGIHGLLASCDRFVATMYRVTGKDPTYPWGATQHQLAYMESNPDWQRINCQDRQPGDVLYRAGHIMLYVGMVNGKDSIASASLGHRSGNLSGTSCSGNQFIADGGPAEGWRKVN